MLACSVQCWILINLSFYSELELCIGILNKMSRCSTTEILEWILSK